MKVTENQPRLHLPRDARALHVLPDRKSLQKESRPTNDPGSSTTEAASARALNSLIRDLLTYLGNAKQNNNGLLSLAGGNPTIAEIERLSAKLLTVLQKVNEISDFAHPTAQLVKDRILSAFTAADHGVSPCLKLSSIGIAVGRDGLLAISEGVLKEAFSSQPEKAAATIRELSDFLRQSLNFYIDPGTSTLIEIDKELNRGRKSDRKAIDEEKGERAKAREELEKRLHLVNTLISFSNHLIDRLAKPPGLVKPQASGTGVEEAWPIGRTQGQ